MREKGGDMMREWTVHVIGIWEIRWVRQVPAWKAVRV
jgi:hypothetical protein